MKRYLLFVGNAWYPRGGLNDLVGSFDDVQAAKHALKPIMHGERFVDYTFGEYRRIDTTGA